MARPQSEARREDEREKPPQAAGDNRRAGDTDGNAEGGNSKSKGATNPVDQPAPAGEKPDES
jgi:hypothetical protein